MMNISVAVLGPGAVGGTLASIFWKKNVDVTIVAKEDTGEKIKKNGIMFESGIFGNFTAYPKIVAELAESPDILFVTVKAPALSNAIRRVAKAVTKRTIVIPLLNGLEHMATLRERLTGRVIAGAISIEAEKNDFYIVFHRSPFVIIRLASDGEVTHRELLHVLLFLREAGIDVRILKSEKEVLWGKLVRLNAIACATSASGTSVGFVRHDPFWKNKLYQAVQEAAFVAQKEGVNISSERTLKEIDALPETLRTSMQRDIENGRQSELDAIAGAVVRAGEKHGILCPAIREFIAIIEKRRASVLKKT
ncbi:MAG: ketopantoate reductase family protein [Candidatus Colwellbacteria bacterium]|nr:ketopantoate reductase family protein [Candidatus Colwellbacteria bacterium]